MRWTKVPDAIRYYRKHGQTDNADRLERELAKANRCRRCGRALTDPLSVKRGIGPECVKQPNEQPGEEEQ